MGDYTLVGLHFSLKKETTRAYRLYLNQKWKNDKRTPKWTNAKQPEWKEER